MPLNDLVSKAKSSKLYSTISKVVSTIDRDKEKEGFQFISPQTRQSIGQATQRVQQSGVLNPFNQLKGFSQALAPVNYGQTTKELFTPILGQQKAGQLGYGLQGATQLTPSYGLNMLSSDYRQNRQQPQTQQEKDAQQIGRATYGLALTAPLGGANMVKNVLGRAVTGAGVGAGIGAGISAVTGGDIAQGAKQGAMSGYSFAPLGAITNPITSKLLAGAPSVLQNQVGQRAIGGVANVVEDELQGMIDGYDTDTQSRITSLLVGAALTGNKDAWNLTKRKLKSLNVKNADDLIKVAETRLSEAYKDQGAIRLSWFEPDGSRRAVTVDKATQPGWIMYLNNRGIDYKLNFVGGSLGSVGGAPKPPTDPTEALKVEARKYKSADEFVKAQGETLYHGTPAKFDTKDFKGGYLTADKNYADVYKNPSASSISYGSAGVKNKQSGNPRTLEFVLPKNAKIFDYTNPQHRKLLDDYWGKSSMSYDPVTGKSGQLDWTEGENLVEYFDEKGIKFDGIKLDEAGGIDPSSGLEVKRSPSIRIINPKILKDKSQLTDLYNQSQLPKSEAINTSQPKLRQSTKQTKILANSGKTQTSSVKSQTQTKTEPTLRQQLKAFQDKKIRAKSSQSGGGSSSVSSVTQKNKKYAFNINKKKLQLDAKTSEKLDKVVETMRPVLEKNKGKTLSKTEIIEGGRKAKVLQDVVGREEAKSFAESLQASRNLLRSESSNVGITPKYLEQLEIVSSVAADAGRRLQAFNIGAEDITIKERVLSDILKVGATAEEVLEAGRKVDWNDADQITDFYRKFKPATIADRLDEFRYTNMLSSPNTHIVNTFSNFLQSAVLAPIEKTIKGGLSFVESRLTGKEQEYFARQGTDYAKGYWRSLPEAFEVFKKTMSGNTSLTKPDVNLIPTSSSKFRKLYTTPLQALEASDQFFRTLIKGGEIESLKTQGITGAEASKLAERSADYRVFRQQFDPDGKLGQNKVLQVWDKWNTAIGNLRNVPGGKYLVPFLQTPTNILKQGFEYSPLGITTVKGSADPLGQLSKTIIGTSVFAGAYALADAGLVTWDTPINSTERAEFYAAGLQPYSVKMGDKWVSFSKIGPLSYPIAMAAALKWSQENGGDEDAMATMGKTMAGTLGFFADQSYVRGIGDIIDAFRGDEYKQARGLSNIPAQMIPYRSFMGWVSRLVDPIYRKTSGGTVPEQIGKSIVSQIPFASKSLPAYETPFGGESERQFPSVNAVSPFSVSQERPEEKAYYDARKQARDENKKVDKILKDIEENKDVSFDSMATDKLLTDQVVKITKKKVEAGIEVTPRELETTYLQKELVMPSSNRYEKAQRDSALWSKSTSLFNDENLSQEQKETLQGKIATELGVSREDMDYYQVAKETNDLKTLKVYDVYDQTKDYDEFMKYLVNGRKPVNGKILISDGVIDNLVDDGLIPYALGKDLKSIDLNEDGSVKTGKIRAKSSKANTDSIKAYSNALQRLGDSLLKVNIKAPTVTSTSTNKINTKGLTFSSAGF